MRNELEKRFEENKGYLTASQMQGSTLRYQLKKLIQEGKVHKVRHGFYVHTVCLKADERTIVADMVPAGLFCLFNSLQEYGLIAA
jgi:predicted metal-binding protein